MREIGNAEDQYTRRKLVVRLRKEGWSIQEVALTAGLHPTRVSTIWTTYRKGGGLNALKPKVRGRKSGEQRKLKPDQETKIKNLIIENSPVKLKLDFSLWGRDAVQSLVLRECGIELPLRTVSNYLQRWEIAPQMPTTGLIGRDLKRFQGWYGTKYQEVVARAKEEDAEIQWLNDSGIRTAYYEEGLAKIERKTRKNNNIISTVANNGKIRFLFYAGPTTSSVFYRFLSLIVSGNRRKVFAILYHYDGHYEHNQQLIDNFLRLQSDKIELFFLPKR